VVRSRESFGPTSVMSGMRARGSGLPSLSSASAKTRSYTRVRSKSGPSPSSSALRIAPSPTPMRLPSARTARSVAPIFAPSASRSTRSPSSASGMPDAATTAAWNAALRLAHRPALKSAKR